MESRHSAGFQLPFTGSQTISLKSHQGSSHGFGIHGDANTGFFVDKLLQSSDVEASGKIKPGDQVTDIRIDLQSLKPEDAKKLLEALAPYPIELTLKNADVKTAKASADIDIGMPSLGIKGKGPKADCDFDADLPSVKGEFDANLPDADLKLKKPQGEGGFHIGLPKFSGPKIEGNVDANLPNVKGDFDGHIDADLPDADVKLKKPKGFGGIDINLPKFSMKGKGPKADCDFDADLPHVKGEFDANLPDADLKLKKPKGEGGFHMDLPKFNLSGPKIEGNVDANLPNVKGDFDGHINAGLPDADVKLKKSKGFGGLDLNLPKFGMKGKGPKVDGDLDVDLPNVKGEFDASLPDADLKLKKPKGEGGFHIDFPKFNLSGPKIEGNADANLPNVKGDFAGHINAGLPDADVKLKKSKGFGGLDMNLPKFGMKGKGPKVDGDLDVDLPQVKGGIDANLPDADLKLKKPKGEGGFHIDFPKFNLSVPKIEGNVDANLPNVKGDFGGTIGSDLPDADIKLKKPKGSGGYGVSVPEFGMKGKGPKLEGDFDASMPGKMTADWKPEISIAPVFGVADANSKTKRSLSAGAGLEVDGNPNKLSGSISGKGDTTIGTHGVKVKEGKPSKHLSTSMDFGHSSKSYSVQEPKLHSKGGMSLGEKIRNFFHIKKGKSDKSKLRSAVGATGSVDFNASGSSVTTEGNTLETNRGQRKKGDRPHSIGGGNELQLGKQNVELKYVSPKIDFDAAPGDIDLKFGPPTSDAKSSQQHEIAANYSLETSASHKTSGTGILPSYHGKMQHSGVDVRFGGSHREAAIDVPSQYK